jgi:hypothetical protein
MDYQFISLLVLIVLIVLGGLVSGWPRGGEFNRPEED